MTSASTTDDDDDEMFDLPMYVSNGADDSLILSF